MRKLVLLLVLLLTGATIAQETAPSGDWRVYVLAGQSGQLLEIGPGGEQARYLLNLPPNTFINANQMRFNDDGTRVAYCLFVPPADPAGLTTYTLIVRDVVGQVNLVERDLGAIAGCTVSAYDSVTNRVAVGIVNVFPDQVEAAPAGSLWSLQLVDGDTGAVLNELNESTPNAPDGAALIPDFPGVVPIMSEVKVLAGNLVVFTAIPWVGRGGAFELPAFAWNIDTGAIGEASDAWGRFGGDFLPSMGELAFPDSDAARPAGPPSSPAPTANVVRVLDASGEITTVFHDPAWTVVEVDFVNGGQQLAIQLLESFDPNNPTPEQDYRGVLLNRDGTQTELLRYPSFYWLESTPVGMIALWSDIATLESPFPGTFIDLFPFVGGGTRAWEFLPQGDQTIFWELAWASPDVPQAGWPAFTAR